VHGFRLADAAFPSKQLGFQGRTIVAAERRCKRISGFRAI
jgi:hypothetical protein